jgi:predicted transcriptional regulator
MEKDAMNRRGWADITIDILESGLTPLSKTRLMYKSNLNYARFQKYFRSFLQKNLLQEVENKDGRTKHYVTSNRGKTLLKALKNAERIFSGN